jgi:hypothetical protein
LQVQHQLSHHLDSEVSEESINWKGDRSAKPKHTPFKIVKQLKGNTSIQLRRCFKDIKYLGYKQHFGTGFKNL